MFSQGFRAVFKKIGVRELSKFKGLLKNTPVRDLRGDPENWWRIAQDSGHNFHFFWDDGFSHGKRAGNALKTSALESTEVVATKNAQTFCPTPSELREPAL